MLQPVRIGVADSGINPRHRHIGDAVRGGVGVRLVDGEIETDDAWVDELGHGTAVAATILGHAPDAELYSIRIFRRRLDAHIDSLIFAIDWAASNGLDFLNLSLGCAEWERRAEVSRACDEAAQAGVVIVAACEISGERSLPGGLAGVIPVREDPEIELDQTRYRDGVFTASRWARTLEELPKERNFHGVSLAVAHVTGIAASLARDVRTSRGVVEALKSRCT